MADADDLVRGLPVLRGLPPDAIAGLPFERVERGPGETFFVQGDPADAVYGVITGRVRIVKQSAGGREICLEVLGPGDVIAVVAVLRKVPMPASCAALERTALVRIPAPAFERLLAREPGMGTRLLDMVSRRLLEAGQSRLSLATDPVEVRVARALLRLCEKFGAERGGEIVFSQAFTRQNLADLAGTTAESTIRVMSRWTQLGWLRSSAARLAVLAPAEIRRIAGVP